MTKRSIIDGPSAQRPASTQREPATKRTARTSRSYLWDRTQARRPSVPPRARLGDPSEPARRLRTSVCGRVSYCIGMCVAGRGPRASGRTERSRGRSSCMSEWDRQGEGGGGVAHRCHLREEGAGTCRCGGCQSEGTTPLGLANRERDHVLASRSTPGSERGREEDAWIMIGPLRSRLLMYDRTSCRAARSDWIFVRKSRSFGRILYTREADAPTASAMGSSSAKKTLIAGTSRRDWKEGT